MMFLNVVDERKRMYGLKVSIDDRVGQFDSDGLSTIGLWQSLNQVDCVVGRSDPIVYFSDFVGYDVGVVNQQLLKRDIVRYEE